MRCRGALAIAACSALVAAGCGDGGEPTTSFTGPDPATLAPADAPLFAEFVVRPEGDQKEALQGALSKLLATDDPGGFLAERLDQALGSSGLTYEEDIEPWLGQRAGIFIETFGDDADGAAAVATTDPPATKQAIDEAAAADDQPERDRAYKGFDYKVDRQGTAAGLVGSFLVAGTEQGLRDAVDASQRDSLADSPDFRTRLGQAPDDQVAFAYAEPRGIVDALRNSGQLTASEIDAADPRLQTLLSQSVAASISATADQLALQASVATSSSVPAPQESSLLGGFPGDSWFAFAASGAGQAYGEALGKGLAQGSSAAIPQGLGFDLAAQLGDWAGDIGGFVRGTSLFGLGGALVLDTGDEQASAQTLSDLQRALSGNPSLDVLPLSGGGEQGFSLSPAGVPIEVQFSQRDGRVVVGLGSDSVDQVFSPDSELDDSESFQAATDALGEEFPPVAYIDFVPLFQLVDGFPEAATDPDYRRAKPYLDHLEYLILGGSSEGDRGSVRLVLGLREASSRGSAEAPGSPASVGVP